MSIINLSGISHNFGDQDIFRKVNFSVEKNSRIGFVGRNGSGKSTLFNIITGKIAPRAGKVQLAKKLMVEYLIQDPELDESKTLYEYILSARPGFLDLEKQLNNLQDKISENSTLEQIDLYNQTQQAFEHAGGYQFQIEIKYILTNLNFPVKIWNQNISSFSGGEKTRLQLAGILLRSYDVLLLDEPTNHLNISMIFWLENYLQNCDKPYVIISHDRRFLNNTITKIVEIENNILTTFKTNFTNYLLEKKQRLEVQAKEFKSQEKFIEKTEDFIRRNLAGQKVAQARSRQKMLDRIEKIEKPVAAHEINLTLNTKNRSGNDVYVFEKMGFGFPGKILAEDINLKIFYKDKIAILGKNGCGKTTLLKLINQELSPVSGTAKKGASLDVGYYDQEHILLDSSLTVMETVWNLISDATRGTVLSYLARFGFRGDDVEKKVSVLSGGEKARLYLAKLIHGRPNFLVLDEPTNHLDLSMIESLEKSLQNFDGTVVFISHDRNFIENVATRKWFFHNSSIFETQKSLDELFKEKKKNIKTDKKVKIKTYQQKINPIILNNLLEDIRKLEKELENTNSELKIMESNYSDPIIYKNEQKIKELVNKISENNMQRETIKSRIHDLELEYLELGE